MNPHTGDRSKMAWWVTPVLVVLPVWALLYGFAFSPPSRAAPVDPTLLGARIYQQAGCAGCHGAHGEGSAVFPRLAGGQAKLTFPNRDDHVNWVKTGSAPFINQRYGDPNRPGGQHGPATGNMPSFAGRLSDAEINMVVDYERHHL